jgi:hypothetical protein
MTTPGPQQTPTTPALSCTASTAKSTPAGIWIIYF